jgi:hypothetical protein
MVSAFTEGAKRAKMVLPATASAAVITTSLKIRIVS